MIVRVQRQRNALRGGIRGAADEQIRRCDGRIDETDTDTGAVRRYAHLRQRDFVHLHRLGVLDGLEVLDFLVAALLVLDLLALEVGPQFGVVVVLHALGI